MTNTQQPVEIQWPFGKGTSAFAISPYTHIHEIPTRPGVYIWALKPRTHREFLLASELFEHATLSATVKGNIRLSYSGELKKATKNPDFLCDPLGESLFADLFFAIGYPLYVGVSKNLRARLFTHKSQFEDRLLKKRGVHLEEIAPSSEFSSDSEDESNYFGGRLASAWNSLSTDCLYVKYVVPRACNTCDWSACDKSCLGNVMGQLRAIEFSANSLFNPVFGRR